MASKVTIMHIFKATVYTFWPKYKVNTSFFLFFLSFLAVPWVNIKTWTYSYAPRGPLFICSSVIWSRVTHLCRVTWSTNYIWRRLILFSFWQIICHGARGGAKCENSPSVVLIITSILTIVIGNVWRKVLHILPLDIFDV